jgi:Raf kinase inhibitor-like YbhB/YbcL family protein
MKIKRSYIVGFLNIFLLAAFFASLATAEGGGHMKVTSPDFADNGFIPRRFSGWGVDVNPALVIENIPAAAKSLALIVDDPDAPAGVWVHWVLYDIPVTARIDENTAPGKQGINDSGGKNYHGPMPPSGIHRYYFKLYALDAMLDLKEGLSKTELLKAIQGHILDQAEFVGRYRRS